MKLFFSLVFSLYLSYSGLANEADTLSIRNHFQKITKTSEYRNYSNIETLHSVAAYIYEQFGQYADTTYYQTYNVNGTEYKNVVSVFGRHHSKTIVLGAHYDVHGNQEGADDNASGVIGLLELAKMFHGKELKHRFELVAYTLEEPPYFDTEFMGSYIHAKSLKENNVDVYGMLSIEMIGYFDENENSQEYPIGIQSWFYGKKANFIMLVNKWGKGKFARRFSRRFKRQDHIEVKKLNAPKALEGIDWSDHANYWKFGYSASMITDTAFYRNDNYHRKSDTMETLDFEKMEDVIEGIYEALIAL